MLKIFTIIAGLSTLALVGCDGEPTRPANQISGSAHYVDGFDPISKTGKLQVVIEIPAGTTQKWEVNKDDGNLHWEIKNGKRRVVQYVGYPGNYGMIPRTLLSYESGGDGDPLDVLVLGPPLARGELIEAKLIGVLNLSDGGEQDDKLIAVMDDTAFGAMNSIQDLDQNFPGALTIIETWFEGYKGPGKMKSSGFSGLEEAGAILETAIKTYAQKPVQDTK